MVNLTMSFVGPTLTVPVVVVAGPGVDNFTTTATWSNVPFTATGTLQILSGTTVVAQDSFTGFGTASAQAYGNTATAEAEPTSLTRLKRWLSPPRSS